MKVVLLSLVLAFAVATQSAIIGLNKKDCISRQPRIYEDKIKAKIYATFEKLRNEGIPSMGLPSIDPLVLNKLHIETHQPGLAELNWTMDAGDIKGATNINVTKITFKIPSFELTYAIHWPEIVGHGKYDMDGVFGGLLPVFGHGGFDVLANDLEVSGSLKLGMDKDKHLFLTRFEILVSLDRWTTDFTGLMDDEPLSQLLSKMISDSVPALLEEYQATINKTISPIVIEKANQVLKNMTINDILGYSNYDILC